MNKTKWGNWELDQATNTLNLVENGRDRYSVSLLSITDSAEMLDWIMQLRMKTWSTNAIIGDLVSAFMDIFDPQGTICGAGQNKKIGPKLILSRYYFGLPRS